MNIYDIDNDSFIYYLKILFIIFFNYITFKIIKINIFINYNYHDILIYFNI